MNYQKLERARIWLALVGAVITGGAALYGVYTKARQATAASYETLAPEVNDLKSAVERLAQENADLRRTLGLRAASVAPVAADVPTTAPTTAPRTTPQARSTARRPRPPAHDETKTATGGTNPGEAPKPEAPRTADQPAPPAEPAPQPTPTASGPAGGIFGEIQKKVPVDFEKAAEIYNEIKKRQGR